MEMRGIEPLASTMLKSHSTTEPHPQHICLSKKQFDIGFTFLFLSKTLIPTNLSIIKIYFLYIVLSIKLRLSYYKAIYKKKLAFLSVSLLSFKHPTTNGGQPYNFQQHQYIPFILPNKLPHTMNLGASFFIIYLEQY